MFVIIYLDDILIFSPNLESHTKHVHQVLGRLLENRLYAKLEKCAFDQSSIEFLGYIVSDQGIAMSPSKVEAITTWPTPSSATALLSFLGLANFYRRFIHNYSKIAHPLFGLSKPSTTFNWTEEAQQVFNLLKTAISSAP